MADKTAATTHTGHTVADPGAGARNDSGLTALVLGFFAAGWFSWTPEASGAWATAVKIGSIASIVVAVFGGIRASRGQRNGAVLGDPATAQRYGLVVAVTFALALVGVGVLGVVEQATFRPVWVCAVVGLHFFPLAQVLRAPLTRWLGVAVTAVALAALAVGVFSTVSPSTVTGTGTGVALLAYSILLLSLPNNSRTR